jgi:hypothetical protein
MRKIIALTLSTVCILSLVGCGAKNVETKPNATESEIVETNPSIDNNEQPTESTETEETTNTILPLPSTINLEALEDSSLAVSFGKENIHKNEDESITIDITVYAYDMYDMVDIANLKEGDTISINGENVEINSIEKEENGAVLINGGIDNDGFTLSTDDSTIYHLFDYNDAKVYNEVGKISLKLEEDFAMNDSSDLENPNAVYTAEDLLKEESTFNFIFTPNDTTAQIANNEIVSITRIFTP